MTSPSFDYITLALLMLFVTLLTLLVSATRHKKISRIQQRELEEIEKDKQREILKAIISTQEQERSRIASNLHDSIGSELAMIRLNISKFAFRLSEGKIEHSALSTQLLKLDDTIEDFRSICRDLYPVSLKNYGFIRTFEELVSKINEGTDITCKYKFNLKEDDLFQQIESKLSLLRIFQEVVTNLIKYAHCKTLDIGFMKFENVIKIILRHDGQPFTNEEVKQMISLGKGVGLASIDSRINMMNGRINYLYVNKGSEILIELPIGENAEQEN